MRYNEKLERKSLATGGSFANAMAITYDVDFANRWTYFTPYREYAYNKALD